MLASEVRVRVAIAAMLAALLLFVAAGMRVRYRRVGR
jgi:hypothetical protein